MSEPITNSVATKYVMSLSGHITLIGTWLASVAGIISPILGLLSAIILILFYVWKWRKESKKINLEIEIREKELENLKKFKIKPIHKEK